jgi:hypothetical protein
MSDLQSMLDDVKRLRDEVKLKIHLGSRDLADELSVLEQRWRVFEEKAQLGHSAGEVGAATKNLGKELKEAYERIRTAL